MKNVIQLVDTLDYIQGNCYQHQLAQALSSSARVTHVSLSQIQSGITLASINCSQNDTRVISTLKLRSLYRHIDDVKRFLNGRDVVVYEQDVWEAYMDNGPYDGAYELIASKLNVKFFAVTTEWWADYVKTKGLPAEFVRMGVLPKYCGRGLTDWNRRTIEVGFKGQMHPHRKALVDQLKTLNFDVTVSAGSEMSYVDYLSHVGQMKIYLHDESGYWNIRGEQVDRGNGLWIKDVEVAAQGTFAIRNYNKGLLSYDIENIPLIRTYEKVDEIPGIVNDILSMNPLVRENMINATIVAMKERDDWKHTAHILAST